MMHQLDWHLLDDPLHRGVQRLVRELNSVYRSAAALHEVDFDPAGFEWIDLHNRQDSIFAWLRRAADGSFAICVSNLTPVVRHSYKLGVPLAGEYREMLNTDAQDFGGSGLVNDTALVSRPEQAHGRPHLLELTLPPLATLILNRVTVDAPGHGD